MTSRSVPSLGSCPICGEKQFSAQPVLWQELIDEWQLSNDEVNYINLQQGFACRGCGNNLRSMTLAAAMTTAFGFTGCLKDFVRIDPGIRDLALVEINPAGNLTPFLQVLPRHGLHSFPQIDMQRLKFETASIDIVVHSDTLEHVPDSLLALRECWRVLKPCGHLFYTVPIIKDRLTRKRAGLPPSYHGAPGVFQKDFQVETEYGANFWCEIFEAGFQHVTMTTLIFPASLAVHAVKS